MAERSYFYRAKNPTGQTINGRCVAGSADNALHRLTWQGYTEIELLTDDFSVPPGDERQEQTRRSVSADVAMGLASATPGGALWLLIMDGYRKLAFLLLVLGAFFLLRRYQGAPFAWYDCGFPLLAVTPFLIVLLLPRTPRYYRELQRAAVEARWPELLTWVERIEPALRKQGASGLLEIAKWRARALAAMGRKDEAVRVMEQVAEAPGVSRASHLVYLSMFHESLHDFQQSRACLEQAVEIDPENSLAWLALAELLAKRFESSAEARSALGRLGQGAMTATTRAGVSFIEAVIALNERRFEDARRGLEAMRAHLAAEAVSTPLAVGLQREVEALLVLACAGAGDVEAARRYFGLCEAALRLHDDSNLLSRCARALQSTAPFVRASIDAEFHTRDA